MAATKNRRILVIDDTPSIHQDFRKLLSPSARPHDALEADEQALFGTKAASQTREPLYEVDSALQGREGLDMVIRALRLKRPYALIFTDMRMPPGWDGVDTIQRILEVTSRVELCICSAYSDYSWHDVIRRLVRPSLRLLRKPFETRELLSLTAELTDKWQRLNGDDAATNAGGR